MYISNINSTSIKLKSIEAHQTDMNTPLVLHAENFLTIIYINKGAADYDSVHHSNTIKKRELLIINPNTTIHLNPLRRLEWISLKLTGVTFTSAVEIASDDQFFHIPPQPYAIKAYLDLALEESHATFRGKDIILKKLTECLLVHILRENNLSIKDATNKPVKTSELTTVQQYIHEHFNEKISLDQLSDIANINKYYLIRLFKQATGLSPIDYLIRVRLEEAEKLLAQSTLAISEISDQIGFHSPSHFSKTFKETHQMSPSAYRRLKTSETITQTNPIFYTEFPII